MTGIINDVITAGPGYVAVGGAVLPGADYSHGTVWYSSNGVTWDTVPHDDSVFGTYQSTITAVTEGGPGLVAVGSISEMNKGIVAWSSTNGTEWTLAGPIVPLDGSGFGCMNCEVTDIIATPSGLFAAGSKYMTDEHTTGFTSRAAVWKSTSGDASTWSEIFVESATPSTTYPQRERSSRINALIETNDYIAENDGPRYVAVGRYDAITDYLDFDSAIWLSSDGAAWQMLPPYDPVFALKRENGVNDGWQELLDVMIIGKAIYVGGTDWMYSIGNESMIWKSLDKGASWERLTTTNPENKPYFGGSHEVRGLKHINAFGFNELAVGKGWSDGDHHIYDSYAIIWRGATGYPRWRMMTEGTSFPAYAAGQVINAGTDGEGENVIIVVGREHDRTPGIWRYAPSE